MISDELRKKYQEVDLEEEYKRKFNRSAPYYDMASKVKPIEVWEDIMIEALEEGRPYEVEYSDDPDVLY